MRALAFLFALPACVAGNPPLPMTADAAPDDEPFEGGSIVTACGESIVTIVGSTAPRPGSAVLGAQPAPRQMHLGLAGDPTRSVVAMWRTDQETLASTVEYGTAGTLDQTSDGHTFRYQPSGGKAVRLHEVHLCGLTPDTPYSYRVGGRGADGTEVWSDTFTFRTAPDLVATPDAEVTIGVLGDTRGGAVVWQQSIETLDALGAPDLLLFSGDAVSLGTEQGEWDDFFDRAEPLLRRVPVISAHGNHDLNSQNYYDSFAMPGDEEDYAIDYGAMHLTVLNDSPLVIEDLRGKAADFLEADLTAHDSAAWKIVMHHRPLWSACNFHGGDEDLRGIWGPIFDLHRVDVVLSGHDHNYERTKPMRGATPQTTAADGTIYVIAGSAGAQLYDSGMGFWTEFSEKTFNLVILRVRVGQLAATAYREDGSMLDQFMILK